MTLLPGTRVRAKQNYEDKKEMWLLQVASDRSLPRAAIRAAVAIGKHMNRKQRLLAWPGYTTIAKEMGASPRSAKRGVKALEEAGHMRVVRSRNGSKNNSNRYHPNVWASQQTTLGVVTKLTLGSDKPDTRVVSNLSPEPMNEPLIEPLIRNKNSENKIVGQGRPTFIAQPIPKTPLGKPNFRTLVPTSEVMEILGVVRRGERLN